MDKSAEMTAYNPPGYVDQFGHKHEWRMHEGWVEHRVDGVIHSTQALQGFLDYQVPQLFSKYSSSVQPHSQASTDQPADVVELQELLEGRDEFIASAGLWDEFVKSLPDRDRPQQPQLSEEEAVDIMLGDIAVRASSIAFSKKIGTLRQILNSASRALASAGVLNLKEDK